MKEGRDDAEDTHIAAIWKSLDKHKGGPNGEIDATTLQEYLKDNGHLKSAKDLRQAIQDADANKDGLIEYREFRSLFLNKVNQEGDVIAGDEAYQSLGYFAAGAAAGIVSRTMTAPLDRLKVHLIAQTDTAGAALEAAKKGAPIQATKHAASTLIIATKHLWAAGGVQSMYAGNGLNVLKVMPESAFKFGCFESTKLIFAKMQGIDDPKDLGAVSNFIAGGIGGMLSQAIVYPLDTIKFRMQCDTVKGGPHGWPLIKKTILQLKKEGGFYRGLGAGVGGMFPYAAIDLGTFDLLKKTFKRRNMRKSGLHGELFDKVELTQLQTGTIGAFSGAFGATAVYPINLIRTRMQTQGTATHRRTYKGFVDCFQQTMRHEGYRGLYKGLTPNLIKVVPSVAITYLIYENSKKILSLN